MVESAARDINAAGGARVCVGHAGSPQAGMALAERLRPRITAEPLTFHFLEAGPAIGAHAGPGAVGIFVLPA